MASESLSTALTNINGALTHRVGGSRVPVWLLAIGATTAFLAARSIKRLATARHSQQCVVAATRKAGFPETIDPSQFPQYILNADGLWLYTRRWTVANHRGVVFISHGFGEHIGRYEHVALTLNSRGFSVFGLDHVGHGQSQGDRGHVECFMHYSRDFLHFVNIVQMQWLHNQRVPSFLLGHSMGATIGIQVMRASHATAGAIPVAPVSPANLVSPTLATATKSPRWLPYPDVASLPAIWPWTGAVISSPAIIPDHSVASPFMRFLARNLSVALPKLSLQPLEAGAISRDATVCNNYNTDPLNYRGGLRARWGWEMLLTMKHIRDGLKEIDWPYLAIHGDKDRLCDHQGTIEMHAQSASRDKTMKIYPGGYHESFNDRDRIAVLRDVCDWIATRSQPVAV